MLQYVLPEEIFIIIPHKCVDVPNPELHWASLRFYSITYLDRLLLCYVTDRINEKGMPHQIL